jgi:hypothetical protein
VKVVLSGTIVPGVVVLSVNIMEADTCSDIYSYTHNRNGHPLCRRLGRSRYVNEVGLEWTFSR